VAVAALKEVFIGCYTEKAKNESLVNVHLKCVLDSLFFFILFSSIRKPIRIRCKCYMFLTLKTNMCYTNGKSEMYTFASNFSAEK
jgi:hypothetical protein